MEVFCSVKLRSMMITVFSFQLLLLSSCGEGLRKKISSSQKLGSEVVASSIISGQEASIAYAICLAFRNKNTTYLSERIGEIFSFQIEHSSCNREKSSTIIKTKLSSTNDNNSLEYSSSTNTLFFKNVEDNHNGYMASICPKVLKGEPVENTFTDGDSKVQLLFSESNGLPVLTALTAFKDNNKESDTYDKYISVREDRLVIQTGVDIGNVIVGLVLERTQTLPCSPSGSESLKQIFLDHRAD